MIIKELLKFEDEKVSLLDREVLLGYVLGATKEYLLMNGDSEVSEELKNLYCLYLARVIEGEPVAYITGSKEFYGLDFYVDERVLIPRPESEILVEEACRFLEGKSGARIVDVGSGSGNIPISICRYFQDQGVDVILEGFALEYSEEACEVLRVNVEQLGVDNVLKVFCSDLMEVVDEGEYFEVITANLPYIGEEKYRFVSAAAEKYEPNMALFGGSDGLELYRRMFEEMKGKGISFGMMCGEFGFAQAEAMGEVLEKFFPGQWVIKPDLAGIERVFVVRG